MTNYLYDGDDTIEELDASGNEVARYAKDPDIDPAVGRIAIRHDRILRTRWTLLYQFNQQLYGYALEYLLV